MFVRSKICGITNIDDALTASNFGADALGFVFYAKSPRYVNPLKAQEIITSLPPFITCVGLVVNPTFAEVNQILSITKINVVQFHGDEQADFCESFNFPYIKAIRVQTRTQIEQAIKSYPKACAILLDSYNPKQFGGTGKTFNWDLIPDNLSKPIILAGGLHQSNIKNAINQVKPYAVDVSGGVEITHGIKDKAKIRTFLATINAIKIAR